MNPTVERFLTHANAPAPGFECFDLDDRGETIGYVAPVQNLLQAGAYPEMLDKLVTWLDDPGRQFSDFYAAVDGAMLYVGNDRETQGVHFCSLFEWEFQTHQMRKDHLHALEEFTGDIRFLTDSRVFAVVPASGNYFSVISHGEGAGKIFYVDHDDWRYDPIADSLNEFIDRIVNDPAQFLLDVGCFTRYSDGTTDTTWVPKRYLRDTTLAE